MKYQRVIRTAVCTVCAGAALSLTGCSISFCGMQLGGKDELVFSCEEDLPDDVERVTETAFVSSGSQKSVPVPDEPDQREETSVPSESPETEQKPEHSDGTVRTDGRVNINYAGTEELMTLNGIGETRAKAIVEYRTQNGAFTKVEDIMQVPGIKEGIFSKIQNQIAVD